MRSTRVPHQPQSTPALDDSILLVTLHYFLYQACEKQKGMNMLRSYFIILGFFILFGMTPAHAGLPESDPTVKMLQKHFEKGHIPTEEELRAGDTWICTEYVASARYMDRIKGPFPKYRFMDMGSSFYADQSLYFEGTPASAIKKFSFTSEGLTGISQNVRKGFLRITSDALMLESVELNEPLPEITSPSISNPSFGLLIYVHCPMETVIPKKIKTKKSGFFSIFGSHSSDKGSVYESF